MAMSHSVFLIHQLFMFDAWYNNQQLQVTTVLQAWFDQQTLGTCVVHILTQQRQAATLW